MVWFSLGTAGELIKVYPLLCWAEEHSVPWRALATGQSPINLSKQWDDFQLPRERLKFIMQTQKDLDSAKAAFSWFLKANLISKTKLRNRIKQLTGVGPDSKDTWVVHGDTLSSLVGARYASKLGIKLVHLEAGLRSPSLVSPFPEEITRRVVSRYARLHLAQDEFAVQNLRKSRVNGKIVDTGANTLLDTISRVLKIFPSPELPPKPYVVANLHRFENLNSSFRWKTLLDSLLKAAKKAPVYFVLHPPTRAKLDSRPDDKEKLLKAGVCLEERMPFTKFLHLLNGASFVLSDGGSNQEECFYLGKPCLLLRNKTERHEGLASQVCVLTEFRSDIIDEFLYNPESFAQPPVAVATNPTEIALRAILAD